MKNKLIILAIAALTSGIVIGSRQDYTSPEFLKEDRLANWKYFFKQDKYAFLDKTCGVGDTYFNLTINAFKNNEKPQLDEKAKAFFACFSKNKKFYSAQAKKKLETNQIAVDDCVNKLTASYVPYGYFINGQDYRLTVEQYEKDLKTCFNKHLKLTPEELNQK